MNRNKYKGSHKAVVYKTTGTIVESTSQVTPAQQSPQNLGGVVSELGPCTGVRFDVPSSRKRLAECLCYICNRKLGADHSQRIGGYIYIFILA